MHSGATVWPAQNAPDPNPDCEHHYEDDGLDITGGMKMKMDPFPDLKISSSEFLDDMQGRSSCPKCQKSRKYFCYTCYVPVAALEGTLPHVKLPVKVDIIKHPGEVEGKSTVAHAAILAPGDVTVYTYPSVPSYTDKDKVVLLFPCKESLTMEEFARQCCHLVRTATEKTNESKGAPLEQETLQGGLNEPRVIMQELGDAASSTIEADSKPQDQFSDGNLKKPEGVGLSPNLSISSKRKQLHTCVGELGEESKKARSTVQGVDRVVFIDGAWSQVHKIYTDDRLKDLTKVELKSQTTKFWRPQTNKPDTYLATIEAIYYFFCEYHMNFVDSSYTGQYDNLLFFFRYLYMKVHKEEGVEQKIARGKVKK